MKALRFKRAANRATKLTELAIMDGKKRVCTLSHNVHPANRGSQYYGAFGVHYPAGIVCYNFNLSEIIAAVYKYCRGYFCDDVVSISDGTRELTELTANAPTGWSKRIC